MPSLPMIQPESPIDCRGCGVCCFHMGYPAYSEDESYWEELPVHLKDELRDFISNYNAPPEGELDGPCFWLDPESRLCKHHEYRPRVCRDFEIGNAQCLDWRKFYQDEIRTT